MQKLGTHYGGWYVPQNLKLNKDSIVYSGGVGEDISFDLILSSKFDSRIYLIDPTQKSKTHFLELKEGKKFTGNIQKDYLETIKDLKPNLEKIEFLELGIYDRKGEMKFYKPENPNYVSHTLIENLYGKEYEIVKTVSIKDIMEIYNHDHIDLLKLDIEGAEIKALNQMLDDQIFPKYILVEFDLLIQGGDKNLETRKLIKRLKKDYKKLIDDHNNITYIRKN